MARLCVAQVHTPPHESSTEDRFGNFLKGVLYFRIAVWYCSGYYDLYGCPELANGWKMQKTMERSLRHLDLHQGEHAHPKHERLKSYLLAELTAGRLRPGQALPSEQRLADVLRIARTTVRQALAGLEHDGLIRRVQGKGTFVDEQVRRRLCRGLDVFALVVPATRTGYYPSLQHGFETACKKVHNQMIVCCTENDLAKQGDLVLQLLDKEVGGVAIVPAPSGATPPYQIRQLRERGIPVVYCHRRVERVQAPLLAIPFRQVGRLAGKALLEHGHRRVAFLAGQRSDATEAYAAGLREAMQSGGGNLPEEFVYFGDPGCREIAQQEKAILPVLRQMCQMADRPTGIMASFDSEAELIYLLLGQLGLKVPEDISRVGFGGRWREGAILRRLTSVTVDEAELGRRAAELLHEMRIGDRPLDDAEEVVMPLRLAEGQTLGPAPEQAHTRTRQVPLELCHTAMQDANQPHEGQV